MPFKIQLIQFCSGVETQYSYPLAKKKEYAMKMFNAFVMENVNNTFLSLP